MAALHRRSPSIQVAAPYAQPAAMPAMKIQGCRAKIRRCQLGVDGFQPWKQIPIEYTYIYICTYIYRHEAWICMKKYLFPMHIWSNMNVRTHKVSCTVYMNEGTVRNYTVSQLVSKYLIVQFITSSKVFSCEAGGWTVKIWKQPRPYPWPFGKELDVSKAPNGPGTSNKTWEWSKPF